MEEAAAGAATVREKHIGRGRGGAKGSGAVAGATIPNANCSKPCESQNQKCFLCDEPGHSWFHCKRRVIPAPGEVQMNYAVVEVYGDHGEILSFVVLGMASEYEGVDCCLTAANT